MSILKPGEEWSLQQDDEMPMLVVKNVAGTIRSPTNDELDRAINILNEQNVFSVRIYCRNAACKDKGSWIMRPIQDLKSTVYACEVCHHPMER